MQITYTTHHISHIMWRARRSLSSVCGAQAHTHTHAFSKNCTHVEHRHGLGREREGTMKVVGSGAACQTKRSNTVHVCACVTVEHNAVPPKLCAQATKYTYPVRNRPSSIVLGRPNSKLRSAAGPRNAPALGSRAASCGTSAGGRCRAVSAPAPARTRPPRWLQQVESVHSGRGG